MLKLLIADDEKIIRETISELIDWKSLGISLMGTAKDGIEAYNMILDEYPDIVLTDIKMPGLSGLELIQKIYAVNKDTQFIILTGYSDFEYAKKAMQYGVRYYLLKPCNEEQIISSLKDVIHDYYDKLATRRNVQDNLPLLNQFRQNLLINLINDGLTSQNSLSKDSYVPFHKDYSKYLDFYTTPYEVCYFHYLIEENMQKLIDLIEHYRENNSPGISFNYLYVHNTLVLFFPSFGTSYEEMDVFMSKLIFSNQSTGILYRRNSFDNFELALNKIIYHIRLYEQIIYTNGTIVTKISNYQNIIREVQNYTAQIYVDDKEESAKAIHSLLSVLQTITDINFLKQLVSSVIVISSSKNISYHALFAAEFLTRVGSSSNCEEITSSLKQLLETLYHKYHSYTAAGTISAKIQTYVQEHLSDPDLSLKWIADNYLYMNVDYVSKKFIKETGETFSKYLTDEKVKKAKELLAEQNPIKIQEIAELVGCGNNPPYFNQIFKKSTGLSPSVYMKKIHGDV
jgi:two-component system response regulator YesN